MNAHAKRRAILAIRAFSAVGIRKPRRALPRQQPPDGIRMSYFAALRPMLRGMKALVDRHLVPRLARLLDEMAGKAARVDAVGAGGLDEIMRRIRHEAGDLFNDVERYRLAAAMAQRTSGYQREQLQRQIDRVLGVGLHHLGPDVSGLIADFTATNVALIKSIPSVYFEQVREQVIEGAAAGVRATELAEDIAERYGVAEGRAALIANDQIGKLFGSLNSERQQALGIDSFVWRTMHDARVRDEHEVLDGETFAWDAPPSEGIPGEAIDCRCFSEPVLDDLIAEAGATDEAM